MDVRRLGSKHGRRRTPSVQGIILCQLLEEIHLGLDHPKHQDARGVRVGRRVRFGFAQREEIARTECSKRVCPTAPEVVRSQGFKN